jgi:hypothetical protein
MSLANYKPPSRDVPLGDTSLHLEGLSLEHIAILVREHLPDLEALLEVFTSAGAKDVEDFKKIAFALVTQAPGFVANLIALSAGEPDSAEQAMKISAAKQIEILLAIGDLTFTEVGGIKKALEMVAGLLSAMNVKKEALTATTTKKAR